MLQISFKFIKWILFSDFFFEKIFAKASKFSFSNISRFCFFTKYLQDHKRNLITNDVAEAIEDIESFVS